MVFVIIKIKLLQNRVHNPINFLKDEVQNKFLTFTYMIGYITD
jgi:hypothetical protein